MGAAIAGESSKSAGRTQANAAREAAELEDARYRQMREDLAPQRQTGYDALNALRASLGFQPIAAPGTAPAPAAGPVPTGAAAPVAAAAAPGAAPAASTDWLARREQLTSELSPQYLQRSLSGQMTSGDSGDGWDLTTQNAALAAEVDRRLGVEQAMAQAPGMQVQQQAAAAPAGPAVPQQALEGLRFQPPEARVQSTQAVPTWRNQSAQAAPTDAQTLLQMDPSYQFRLREGMDALEGGAAARGGALSGTALKAGQRYAQELASTEYGNAYGRMMQLAQREWDQNAALDDRDYNVAGRTWEQANALDTRDWNRAFTSSQLAWDRLAGLAGQGQTATTNTAQMGAASGARMGDLITGGAAASAAGQVGQGNAWMQGAGQALDYYNQSRMLDLYSQRSPYSAPPARGTMYQTAQQPTGGWLDGQ